MRILATGPGGPAEDLDPLRQAGHELVIGRPLDDPARRAYTESEFCQASGEVPAHVVNPEAIARRRRAS